MRKVFNMLIGFSCYTLKKCFCWMSFVVPHKEIILILCNTFKVPHIPSKKCSIQLSQGIMSPILSLRKLKFKVMWWLNRTSRATIFVRWVPVLYILCFYTINSMHILSPPLCSILGLYHIHLLNKKVILMLFLL